MSLPLAQPNAQPIQAKFEHAESGVKLRLQCFLVVRDDKERIACVRVQGIDGWCLPAESMYVNESPDQAAVRVARMWFKSPVGMQLERVLSFPATGADDDRWYMIFVYHADAPAQLIGTDDTEEIMFFPPGAPPERFAMAHGDVWAALTQ